MIVKNNKIIESSRLYLRDFRKSDFTAVHEYGSIPEFSQYEQWGPNTEPHSLNFIIEAIKKASHIPRYDYELAVILKSTEQLIGSAHIAKDTQESRVGNIGYAINPKFQNQGYATEVARSLIDFGFKSLNLLVIYATCDTRNISSYKVLEKSGMHKVGHTIGDRQIRGQIYDSFRYEIYAANSQTV
jgi:ribosomal-protein-alanine N-acetyltransferase